MKKIMPPSNICKHAILQTRMTVMKKDVKLLRHGVCKH